MLVPSIPEGYMVGQCGKPDRQRMNFLIPLKAGDDGAELWFERRLTAYMISGQMYCII